MFNSNSVRNAVLIVVDFFEFGLDMTNHIVARFIVRNIASGLFSIIPCFTRVVNIILNFVFEVAVVVKNAFCAFLIFAALTG